IGWFYSLLVRESEKSLYSTHLPSLYTSAFIHLLLTIGIKSPNHSLGLPPASIPVRSISEATFKFIFALCFNFAQVIKLSGRTSILAQPRISNCSSKVRCFIL